VSKLVGDKKVAHIEQRWTSNGIIWLFDKRVTL